MLLSLEVRDLILHRARRSSNEVYRLIHMAQDHERKGENDQALPLYQKALEISGKDSRTVDSNDGLQSGMPGNVLLQREKLNEAETLYQRAIAIREKGGEKTKRIWQQIWTIWRLSISVREKWPRRRRCISGLWQLENRAAGDRHGEFGDKFRKAWQIFIPNKANLPRRSRCTNGLWRSEKRLGRMI